MKVSIRIITFIFLIGAWIQPNLSAQEILGSHRLKDASVEKSIYPYGWVQYSSDFHEVGFKPIVKLSDNDFAYLWKPQLKSRKRMLTAFSMLLEQQWETEIEVEFEEAIFALYKEKASIIMLSYNYDAPARLHQVIARRFDPANGTMQAEDFIYQFYGKGYHVLGYDFSQDSSKMTFYHFLDDDDNKKVRNLLDFPFTEGGAGYKVTNSTRAYFQVYNRNLDTVASGEMPLVSSMKAKSYVVDGQVDNEGNMVFSIFQEPHVFSVHRYDMLKKETQMLRYTHFPKMFKDAPYVAMTPPYVGARGQVYAPFAERERIRSKRYTRFFKVLNFDFERQIVDTSRIIPITSAFQVQLNKSREAVNLRPETVFDHYMIKNIIELEDSSLWMIVQKYERGSQPQRVNARTVSLDDVYVSNMEEILLFEFDPKGKIRKVIMIPMLQQAILPLERVGRFYTYQLDRKDKVLHLITREYDGPKHTESPRIFYRKVDLATGLYTDRQQIFDSKKRTHYLLRDYTLFLNPFVAILTDVNEEMLEHPDIVSVKFEGLA